MRTDIIDKCAAKGKLTLKYPTAVEICLYSILKQVYSDYKNNAIDLGTAKKQKAVAVLKCSDLQKDYDNYLSVFAAHQDSVKAYHDEIDAIEKSRDKDEILKLALDVVGKITGDSSFLNRQLKKFC